MSRPGRDTTAGRVYLDLQARAREEGRPTGELLVLYVHERLLFRVGRSSHRSRLILKGGMLLAALEERRPTRDVDLLAQAIDNDIDAVSDLVRDVLAVTVDDGVEYDVGRMQAKTIRDIDPNPGVRIVVPAHPSSPRGASRRRQHWRSGDAGAGRTRIPEPARRTVHPARLSDRDRPRREDRDDDRPWRRDDQRTRLRRRCHLDPPTRDRRATPARRD